MGRWMPDDPKAQVWQQWLPEFPGDWPEKGAVEPCSCPENHRCTLMRLPAPWEGPKGEQKISFTYRIMHARPLEQAGKAREKSEQRLRLA